MVILAYYVFWIGVSIVLYTYLGYGLVIYILSKIKNHSLPDYPENDNDWPDVTMIVAAYNEEGYIEEKIADTLALDYPKGKLSFYVVTDGSTDRTPELVKQHSTVTLFHETERKGKIHAVNRVMKFVKTPVVIFSDANTNLNAQAIKNI